MWQNPFFCIDYEKTQMYASSCKNGMEYVHYFKFERYFLKLWGIQGAYMWMHGTNALP